MRVTRGGFVRRAPTVCGFGYLVLHVVSAAAQEWPYNQQSVRVGKLACTEQDSFAKVKFIFPENGLTLDMRTDVSIGGNLLVRMQVTGFRLKVDGAILLLAMSLGDALNARRREDGNGVEVHVHGESAYESQWKMVSLVSETNVEFIGAIEGAYMLLATLVDFDGNSRSCWHHDQITFNVGRLHPKNRSESLLIGLRSMRHHGSRMRILDDPWLIQPESQHDFAYVTVLWSEDYVDSTIAWATGLVAAGSTFRRVCLVVKTTLSRPSEEILNRCCCDIIAIDPIHAPRGMVGHRSRYELALTKLRVFQLRQHGLRKIVLMDSDILILQNIDELFWFPAPAATVSASTLLGTTTEPKLSTGVMIIEPSEEEFHAVMRRLDDWIQSREGLESPDIFRFIEQDLLDMHWFDGSRPKYHVLPLVYNLYPELLDTLPFLDSGNGTQGTSMKFPLDHGVKVVHLWHWYNPMLVRTHNEKQILQNNAKLKHPVIWSWYELFWKLHQQGLAVGMPEKFPIRRDACIRELMKTHGITHDVASKFFPTVQGLCMHTLGGLMT